MTQLLRSETNGKRVTIKDVALRAGVGHPSVSAVLNGAKGQHVAAETRERILQAANEMGYRPNLAARSISQRRSMQVGVLIRNNVRLYEDEIGAHPLAWEFVLGINRGLEEGGYMMSLVRLCDFSDRDGLSAPALQGHLLDGLIVVNSVPSLSPDEIELLTPASVWLDSDVWRDERCLRRDERGVGALAARELAALGYRELLVLRRPNERSGVGKHYSELRWDGLSASAAELGLGLAQHPLPYTQEAEALEKLTHRLSPEVAVVALDAYAAYSVLRFAAFSSLRIGSDFALACCDDSFNTAGLSFSGLSHVRFNRYEMGVEAARMMLKLQSFPDASCPSQILSGTWHAAPSTPRLNG